MDSDASAPKSRRWSPSRPLGRCGFCQGGFDPFGRCRRSACPGYIHVWVRDQRERLSVNLSAYTDGAGTVWVATITAPGSDVLPWDRGSCAKRGQHRCSGELGCRVRDADFYNRTAPDRFSTLHRTASRRAKRAAGCEFVLLARVWELHGRGVLHIHPIIACGTDRQRRGAAAYVRAASALARSHGFGFVDRSPKSIPAERAAGYCGKRLTETVRMSASPGRIVWVAPRLTRTTGCTTRVLRERRHQFV